MEGNTFLDNFDIQKVYAGTIGDDGSVYLLAEIRYEGTSWRDGKFAIVSFPAWDPDDRAIEDRLNHGEEQREDLYDKLSEYGEVIINDKPSSRMAFLRSLLS